MAALCISSLALACGAESNNVRRPAQHGKSGAAVKVMDPRREYTREAWNTIGE